MKNKGFTLIEVMAAVSLLLLITVISVVTIMNNIAKNNGKVSDAQMVIFENAAFLFIQNNPNTYPAEANKNYCISLKQLADDELLALPVLDENKDEININENKIKVTISSSLKFSYEYTKNCN